MTEKELAELQTLKNDVWEHLDRVASGIASRNTITQIIDLLKQSPEFELYGSYLKEKGWENDAVAITCINEGCTFFDINVDMGSIVYALNSNGYKSFKEVPDIEHLYTIIAEAVNYAIITNENNRKGNSEEEEDEQEEEQTNQMSR